MQLLVYCIAYPFLWFISIVPFRILYFFSDLICFFIYHIIRYRRKVVRANLKLALPEKSASEIKKIERQFYSHMCDMFLEMIKTMNISETEMQKRFTFDNIDFIRTLEKKKSILMMFPHYASWEWVIAMNKHIESEGYAVYQRIANTYFDRLIRQIREKFGTKLIQTRETPSIIRNNKSRNIKSIYGFLSDQSPLMSKAKYWANFMGVKVPVHIGAEVLAKKFDLAVVYLQVTKVKRGYYSASFKLLAEHPKEVENFGITDLFIKEVENQIKTVPSYYFWTHKRWKHKDRIPEMFR